MSATLTGQTRHRHGVEGLFRRRVLVLQVEEEVTGCEPLGPTFESTRFTRWRDATVEDLSTLFVRGFLP